MKVLKNPIVVLLIAAIISAAFYFVRTEMFSDWQSVTGTVTMVEVRGRSKRRSVNYNYTYTVDSQQYTGYESFSGRKAEYKVGDQKEVWYDPDDPSSSRFIKPGPELYVYVPLLLGIPLALAAADSGSGKQRGKRPM